MIERSQSQPQAQSVLAIRPELEITAGQIDLISRELSVLSTGAPPVAKAMRLAAAQTALVRLMTQPVVEAFFMPLMNKDFGFRTDRDPSNPSTPDAVPYTWDVVRDCVIDGLMHGLFPTGNEINIIARGCYAAKNGLLRKTRETPGLSRLKIDYGLPESKGEGGAVTEVIASWTFNGEPDSITAKIPTRVNKGMGADGVLGKVCRKIHARILERITGQRFEEDEPGDVDKMKSAGGSAPTFGPKAPTFDKSKSTDAEISKPTPGTAPAPGPDESAEAAAGLAPEPAKEPAKPKAAESKSAATAKTAPTPPPPSRPETSEPESLSPQEMLQKIVTDAGFTFADFRTWGEQSGNFQLAPVMQGFADLPAAMAARYIGDRVRLLRGLVTLKKG